MFEQACKQACSGRQTEKMTVRVLQRNPENADFIIHPFFSVYCHLDTVPMQHVQRQSSKQVKCRDKMHGLHAISKVTLSVT